MLMRNMAGTKVIDDSPPSPDTQQKEPHFLTDSTQPQSDDELYDEKPWDPTKLPGFRKILIIIAGFTCTFNGNLGSTMPSGALDAISSKFGVSDRLQLTLLNSLWMVGYVLSPLIFGPLSEYIGRRFVLIGTFLGYLIFILACSVSPSYEALLVFRLIGGFNAAAPTTVLSGLYADILDDPSQRGMAIAVYMCVTNVGPLIGPIISGFTSQVSWQWPFWVAGLIAVVGLPVVLILPETFAPVLSQRHTEMMRKKGFPVGTNLPHEHYEFSARKIFLRPFTLLFTEPIVLFTSMYLTLAYAIMYLMFQAYPIVFEAILGFYGLTPGMAGLAYIPMFVGLAFALLLFHLYTRKYDNDAKAGKKWAHKEVNRRLPIACVASPCIVISLFWLGWTSWESVSPIVASIGGMFFMFGNTLLFMGMSNYMNDVYRQLSASAQAASSMTRSIGAVILPLAAQPMYSRLGIHWAPSLLGFIALVMGLIPFLLLRYGDAIARRSKYARDVYRISD
ncbi:Major facilitator superfamily multidrug transporter mdrA [Paramyrothecium foliicola]|nr:Major facilitator superfamily multidrug transporter mdrA [Paramyrothecium foliicola]